MSTSGGRVATGSVGPMSTGLGGDSRMDQIPESDMDSDRSPAGAGASAKCSGTARIGRESAPTAEGSPPDDSCESCGGTGWWWLDRSWFKSDGYYKERCHHCRGTGRSDVAGDPDFAARQADKRREMKR